jgi:hypothetical protein
MSAAEKTVGWLMQREIGLLAAQCILSYLSLPAT